MIGQQCMIEEHKHKAKGSRAYGSLRGYDSNDASWMDEEFTENNLIQIMPYGGIETRPLNFTCKIWKRTN